MIRPNLFQPGFRPAIAKPALKVHFGNDAAPAADTEDVKVAGIKAAIREFPDFPKPGIAFKDIMPVLKNPQLFQDTLDYFANYLAKTLKEQKIQYVAGIESRGFMLGAPLAQKIGAGFIPIRKAGKLPGDVEGQKYDLEYGTDKVEIQADAIEPGANVVLVDDLLATGGTANAAAKLLTKVKANLKSILFLVELDALKGREKLNQPELQGTDIHSMIHY